MIVREKDGLWVNLQEEIAAHYEEVFACLTTEAGLSRWFSLGANVDLRSGGTIELKWDQSGKHSSTITILNFDPGGSIVWDWHASVSDMHAPVYWTVKPEVEQGAIVTLRQGPFRDDRESLIAMAEEAEGWRRRLCNLRAVLEMQYDMRKVRPL